MQLANYVRGAESNRLIRRQLVRVRACMRVYLYDVVRVPSPYADLRVAAVRL